jgi:hypothetical protein
MKGDIPVAIVLVVLAIVFGFILFLFFSGYFAPVPTKLSVEKCKQDMQSACGAFRSTGNSAVFNGIPKTCADSLGVSSLFKACVSGTTDQCRSLCESIEIGVVTPPGGGEVPSPTGGEIPSPPTLPQVGG